uniref:Cytochrome P450 monooxygenase btcB n=1 Tax=Colletotrichum orbiculare (strain 104-T / ATCC 96160 / CBS 514.97 / LARS 414 / MAFF 240422) TaxID=1213857 RepID=BTCB_COLOR|nr:RecName: Full=Cytochrome P450 monooxygenase btcB; AltName: Full=Betaestacins biosynthesis cluster protein B [Colletotrichum orbiculare MAFF 240422]
MASSSIASFAPFESYSPPLNTSETSLISVQLTQDGLDYHGALAFLCGALLFGFVYSVFYNLYLSPIARVPGPLIAQVSPLWLMRAVCRKQLNCDIKKLHEKYGKKPERSPVVRLSPTEVSFATVEAQNAIHRPGASAKQGLFFTKEGTLEAMMGEIIWPATNLLTATVPEEHQRLKKALQPAFTEKALQLQEPIQQQHTDRLIRSVQEASRQNRVVDLTPHMSQAIWDIISDLSFGEPLLKDQLAKFERLKTTFCMVSPLLEALQVLLAVPGAQTLAKACVGLVPLLFWLPTNVLPSAQLRKRFERQDSNEDFLTAIMRCREMGIQMTDMELQSNASLLVMVGYDTTATSLSATMNLLLRHPLCLQALQDELHSHFSSTSDMTSKPLSQLPILNGCIQESLRLFPPANGKGTNRTSPGTMIDGVYIPRGVNVSADMYTIQRSPTYWSRPNEFCPDRWFDNGPGTEFAQDVRSSHNPFLLGPRMCIGRAVALQSMRMLIAKLVYTFDLEAVEDYSWDLHVANSYLWTGYRCNARV